MSPSKSRAKAVALAFAAVFAAGCEVAGPLDDCVCKLDAVEMQRCVSDLFCSGFAPATAELEAEACCGVGGATFQSFSDITSGEGETIGCSVRFDTPDGENLTVTCSDDFGTY